jgi:hypothetical protein
VVLNERKHVGGAKDGDEAVAPDKKKTIGAGAETTFATAVAMRSA